MRFYAGIGSRGTPPDVLALMRDLGFALAVDRYTLRSGGAEGADTAFEEGATWAGGAMEIFLPWQGFNGNRSRHCGASEAARALAATLHPAWSALSHGARTMHARNCHQVLGAALDSPCAAVICWTPDGCESSATRTRHTGGTATGIVLAERQGIPVFNLQRPASRDRLTQFLSV